MTPADAAKLLAVAAVYDHRTVSRLDAEAWADALNDLEPAACADAIRIHYRTNTTWCMPAHIRVIVEQHRRTSRPGREQRAFRELDAAKAKADPAGAQIVRKAFAEAIAARHPDAEENRDE